MKKNVSYLQMIVLVLIFVMTMVAGSTALHGRIEMGLKGGIQQSGGFRAGISVGFILSKYISIQPELNFSQLKHNSRLYDFYQRNTLYPGTQLQDTVNMLETPVLLKVKFKMSGLFKPFVQIGGYAWFSLADSNGYVDSAVIPQPSDWPEGAIHYSSVRTGRRYTKSGGGYIIAPGFSLGKGKIKFQMEFRLTYDLTNRQNVDYASHVHNDDGGEDLFSLYTAKFKSKKFAVMCGIIF